MEDGEGGMRTDKRDGVMHIDGGGRYLVLTLK